MARNTKIKPKCEQCDAEMLFMHRDTLPPSTTTTTSDLCVCSVHSKYSLHKAHRYHSKIAFRYDSRDAIHCVGCYYHCRGCALNVCGGCALIRKEAEFRRQNMAASAAMKRESSSVDMKMEVEATTDRPSKKRRRIGEEEEESEANYKALYLAEVQ